MMRQNRRQLSWEITALLICALSPMAAWSQPGLNFRDATIVPLQDSAVATGQDTLEGWKPTTTAGDALNSLMADAATCKTKVEADKKSADPIAKAKINKDNICPNLNEMPALTHLTSKCSDAVGQMESAFNEWQAAKEQSCFATAKLETKCAGESCLGAQAENARKANEAAEIEKAKIKSAKEVASTIDKTVAAILDQIGAEKARIEEVESQRDTNIAIVQSNNENTVAGDNGSATLEQANTKYQANSQRLRNLAREIVRSGLPKDSGISGDRATAEADPVKIGQANSSFKSALDARNRELENIQRNLRTNEDRSGNERTNMSSLGSGSIASGGASDQIPVSALTSAGVAGAQIATANTAGGGATSTGINKNLSSLTSDDLKSGLNLSNLPSGKNIGSKAASRIKQDFAEDASNLGGKEVASLETNNTAASIAPSGSVRESLQARLKNLNTSGASVMGAASKADSAKSAAENKADAQAKNAGPSASPKLLNSEGEIITDSMGSLGVSDFSLEGSDTDSFIQNMVEDSGIAGERGLASVAGSNDFGMSEAQLLSEEGPSLFERVKFKNNLSVKRGDVSLGLRSKL